VRLPARWHGPTRQPKKRRKQPRLQAVNAPNDSTPSRHQPAAEGSHSHPGQRREWLFCLKRTGIFRPPSRYGSRGVALSSRKAARRDVGCATECPAAPYGHASWWLYISHPVLQFLGQEWVLPWVLPWDSSGRCSTPRHSGAPALCN
jgi:hypothetical protein